MARSATQTADSLMPRKVSLLERYLARSDAFEGIGTVKARKLVERFGDGLHRALSGRHPGIAEVLGEDRAATLFQAYQLKLAEADIAVWLDENGVDPQLGSKIIRFWGGAGAVRLRQNPYLLIAFIGWASVERLAQELGIRIDDPRRLVAAVEAVLYKRLDQSHTWCSPNDLQRELKPLLRDQSLVDRAPDLAVSDLGAVDFDGGYQPAGAAAMEQFIAGTIASTQAAGRQYDLVARELSAVEIDRALDDVDRAHPWPLTPMQRSAVRMALTARIGMLGGYAGSGKTSVLAAVCQVGERFGRVMHLMALSGRAARRISEATHRPASTIAAFLRRIEEKEVSLGPECIVVIDEASMIDLPTLYRLIRRIGSARLLMVGDPAQLPPIGFGSTFHALIGHPAVESVVLDRVHRQTVASGIPTVSELIRQGELPVLRTFDGFGTGVSFLDCPIEQACDQILRVGQGLAAGGAARGEIQIISPIRAGEAGIQAINRFFHERRAERGTSFPGRPEIAAGDPVIWTKNDYDRELQNGSMGRFQGIVEGRPIVELNGRVMALRSSDGPNLDLAYAISVHKSQGSQWSRVIVPLYSSQVLDRTLVYTAVTRASKQVILVGDRIALERAIKASAAVDRRETRLGRRLELALRGAGSVVV